MYDYSCIIHIIEDVNETGFDRQTISMLLVEEACSISLRERCVCKYGDRHQVSCQKVKRVAFSLANKTKAANRDVENE